MSRPWTDAHRRETALVLLDEARTLLLDGDDERARDAANEATAVLADARDHAGTSAKHLRDVAEGIGIDGRRVLRRVRAIAEGRLVRKSAERWRVYAHPGNKLLAETHDDAQKPNKRSWVEHLKGCDPNGLGGCSVVRVHVARVRRAS